MLMEEALEYLARPLRRVAIPDVPIPTPAVLEQFVLPNEEKAGFNTFVSVGCAACHNGPYVGGGMFQKAGLVNPWPDTTDVGREAVTHQPADRMVFKVPSLRNVERTGPYFHDGKVASLDSALTTMAHAQLGKQLTPEQIQQITAWLKTLTGDIPAAYITPPTGS